MLLCYRSNSCTFEFIHVPKNRLVTGNASVIISVDTWVTYRVTAAKSSIKIGTCQRFQQPAYSVCGQANYRGLYYVAATVDELLSNE